MANQVDLLFNSTVASFGIAAAFEMGLLDELQRNGRLDITTYCNQENLHRPSIEAIVGALACFDIVNLSVGSDGTAEIGKGPYFEDVYQNKGYFLWLMHGYGYLMQHLALVAENNNRHDDFIRRDGKYIALASRDYGAQFVDRHFESVLQEIPFTSAADLGCGSANRLISLAKQNPDFHGVGVEINTQAVEFARLAVGREGLTERISVVQGDAAALNFQEEFADVEIVFCFFMGHDLWPREQCANSLQKVHRAFPNTKRFLLCDTYKSNLKASPDIPIFTLGFEVIHAVMGQYIPTLDEWFALFSETGWHCVKHHDIDIAFSTIFDLRPLR